MPSPITRSVAFRATAACFQTHLHPQDRHSAQQGYLLAVERGFIQACPTTTTNPCYKAIEAHLEGDAAGCQRWVRTVEQWDGVDGDKVVRSRWLDKVLKGLR